MEVKPTRVFTKDAPCTKVHLWNAFIGANGLRKLAVVHSRGEIGLNAPKYLKNNGYIVVLEEKGVEYYEWTPEGEVWLRKGLLRHLELHPEEIPQVQFYLQLTKPQRARRVTRVVPQA